MSPAEREDVRPFRGTPFWGDDSEWLIAEGHVPEAEFRPWALAQVAAYYGRREADEIATEYGDDTLAQHGYASPGTAPWRGYEAAEWWAWHKVPGDRSVPITVYSLEGSRVFVHDHPVTTETPEPEPPSPAPPPPKRPEDYEGVRRVDTAAIPDRSLP